MCLIISKPAHVDFGREWLRDFWMSNRDGAGIMWVDEGEAVNVEKITSPSCEEWIDFYDSYARGRECVIHLRYRTHGNIDEENTHPYFVGRGYFLMHNGVLSSGNAKDRSKSDTWHFINDSLRPALRKSLENADFLKAIGERIGRNNRMVILGPNGKAKIINRGSGVVWQGAWFSNTYAWSAPRVGERMVESAAAPVRASHVFERKTEPAKPTAKPAPKPAVKKPAKPAEQRMGPQLQLDMPDYMRSMLWDQYLKPR